MLGTLTAEEIHYRLLTAPFGAMLRTLSAPDSSVSAVGRAIGYIRADLRAPVVVPELARHVGMSPSAFHKHFKAVTATTPLQYQKELRLLEARHLLTAGRSVTAAAFDVGYASFSQFSREYAPKYETVFPPRPSPPARVEAVRRNGPRLGSCRGPRASGRTPSLGDREGSSPASLSQSGDKTVGTFHRPRLFWCDWRGERA